MLGKPLHDVAYFDNTLILQDVLANYEFGLPEYESYYGKLKNPGSITMIYNYYKDRKDSIDITSSRLFYTNPLILLDYAGKEIPMPPPLELDRFEEVEILLQIAKDKPAFSRNVGNKYFFEKLIKDDPVRMMNLIPYESIYKRDIIKGLKEVNYKFDENTPLIYLNDAGVLLQLLQENNDRIEFVLEVIEKNRIGLDYSNRELADYVSKVIVEKGLGKYAKYVSSYDLNDYLIECINKDFSIINNLVGVRIDMTVLKHIFTLAVEKIKSGEYIVDENTPQFLFYNDEVRALVRDINPRLLDNCGLERLDRARDHSLIEEAINDPSKIDELFNIRIDHFIYGVIPEIRNAILVALDNFEKAIDRGNIPDINDKCPRLAENDFKIYQAVYKQNPDARKLATSQDEFNGTTLYEFINDYIGLNEVIKDNKAQDTLNKVLLKKYMFDNKLCEIYTIDGGSVKLSSNGSLLTRSLR